MERLFELFFAKQKKRVATARPEQSEGHAQNIVYIAFSNDLHKSTLIHIFVSSSFKNAYYERPRDTPVEALPTL